VGFCVLGQGDGGGGCDGGSFVAFSLIYSGVWQGCEEHGILKGNACNVFRKVNLDEN
jgi:hypothetical protein